MWDTFFFLVFSLLIFKLISNCTLSKLLEICPVCRFLFNLFYLLYEEILFFKVNRIKVCVCVMLRPVDCRLEGESELAEDEEGPWWIARGEGVSVAVQAAASERKVMSPARLLLFLNVNFFLLNTNPTFTLASITQTRVYSSKHAVQATPTNSRPVTHLVLSAEN